MVTKCCTSDSVEQNHSLEERQGISNDNSNLDKLSLPDVKLKDLTWTVITFFCVLKERLVFVCISS